MCSGIGHDKIDAGTGQLRQDIDAITIDDLIDRHSGLCLLARERRP